MATINPFDLLGDDDTDDPAQLIAKVAAKKPAPAPVAAAPAKLPTKPLPPAQAVREARATGAPARGGGRGGPGRGRGGRGGGYIQSREFGNGNIDGSSGGYGGGGGGGDGEKGRPVDRERGSYGGYRGGRRGGYGEGEAGAGDEHPPRRVFERRSGTGRGNEFKREGSGRGNWGTTDDVIAQESEETVVKEDKTFGSEKQTEQEKAPAPESNKDNKEGAGAENEEKEQEEKEMTLEEYEKIREEKRKALLALKTEERKVNIDKELEAMKQLEIKKGKDPIFIKLGTDKESKKQKENADRDEKAKKSVSITEFLKPAEGERYYSPGGRGRGRGRGRGDRAPFRGDYGRGGEPDAAASAPTPVISITDQEFPTLGGK